MTEALYGPGGFYARGEAPADHFRTSVHASPLFAEVVLTLLRRVDAALSHPDPVDLVDIGAGRGELLRGVAALLPVKADPAARGADLSRRLRLTAVEVAARPADLPPAIGWAAEVPPLTGLAVANEWLDNVPLDVIEHTADGPRLVLVDRAGWESLDGTPADSDLSWLRSWWPDRRPGERVEVGRTRDEAWSAVVRRLRRGVAVAVDYAHEAASRPPAGTLTGYRGGRRVRPVPDGSCDLTAHVALDACEAAGVAAGATATLRSTQREALRRLGMSGGRPPIALAHTDPVDYLRRLERAGQAAELADPDGLGSFGWLVQAVGVELPLP
jgi:SAM-dependent MidA family methyltransferase